MVHHIVMWKLHPKAEGHTKTENAQIIKEMLEDLQGKIDCICALRAGINENGGDYDVILVTEFQSKTDLQAYDIHPLHQQVKTYIQKAAASRACVDFTDE